MQQVVSRMFRRALKLVFVMDLILFFGSLFAGVVWGVLYIRNLAELGCGFLILGVWVLSYLILCALHRYAVRERRKTKGK